jgi:hypothetical protein
MNASGLKNRVRALPAKSSSKMASAVNSASDDFHNESHAQSQSTEEI